MRVVIIPSRYKANVVLSKFLNSELALFGFIWYLDLFFRGRELDVRLSQTQRTHTRTQRQMDRVRERERNECGMLDMVRDRVLQLRL